MTDIEKNSAPAWGTNHASTVCYRATVPLAHPLLFFPVIIYIRLFLQPFYDIRLLCVGLNNSSLAAQVFEDFVRKFPQGQSYARGTQKEVNRAVFFVVTQSFMAKKL